MKVQQYNASNAAMQAKYDGIIDFYIELSHTCVCTFTPLLIQSARFTTDKPVYYILMVKESTESQLSFTFTPQNGE